MRLRTAHILRTVSHSVVFSSGSVHPVWVYEIASGRNVEISICFLPSIITLSPPKGVIIRRLTLVICQKYTSSYKYTTNIFMQTFKVRNLCKFHNFVIYSIVHQVYFELARFRGNKRIAHAPSFQATHSR